MRKVINLKFDQNDGLKDKLLASIGHLSIRGNVGRFLLVGHESGPSVRHCQRHHKGVVTNYGEGGATKREGGAREVLPPGKGGAEQVLAILKGGAQKVLG